MPNRELREGIRSSEKIAKLTDSEFRLFVLLMAAVDDFGRFSANPRLVRSTCYPFGGRSAAKCHKTIQLLASKQMLSIYIVKDKEYLQIHQWRGRRRANKSKCPEPPMSVKCQADAGQPPGNRVRGSRIEDRGSGGEGVTPMFPKQVEKELEKARVEYRNIYERSDKKAEATKLRSQISTMEGWLRDQAVQTAEGA